MAHCCVPECTSNWRKDKTLTFHVLPSDEELKQLWIIAIRRDVGPFFQVTKRTYVCALHFKASDYKHSLTGRKLLIPKAVPSVFAWTKDKCEPKLATRERTRISPVIKRVSFTSEKVIAPSIDHTYNLSEYVIVREEMNLEGNFMQDTDCEEGNCSHDDKDKQIDCLQAFIKKLKEEIHLKDILINKLEEELTARNNFVQFIAT